jgi:uncharacterized membrane protein
MQRVLSIAALAALVALAPRPPRVDAQGRDFLFISFDAPHSSDTKADGINARGDVVGRYFDANLGPGPHGFLRHADGTFVAPIEVPADDDFGTVPRGINAPGDIVGKYFYDAFGSTHGFLLKSGGTFTWFDVPGGDPGTTIAEAVNNEGQIVGPYNAPVTIPGCGTASVGHGYVRDERGTFTSIDYPGAISTSALGINDVGEIVGIYVEVFGGLPLTDCDPRHITLTVHGYLRTPAGVFRTIDSPFTDAVSTVIHGISDSGEMTGWYLTERPTAANFGIDSITLSPDAFHNFVVSRTGAFTTFDLASLGLPPGAGGLVSGINARGSITGTYADLNGVHGFLGVR